MSNREKPRRGSSAPGRRQRRAVPNSGFGDAPPKDAHVAVQYDKRWFWIADTGIESKYTFGIVMLLFSIAETGVKGAAPVVTIPANQ